MDGPVCVGSAAPLASALPFFLDGAIVDAAARSSESLAKEREGKEDETGSRDRIAPAKFKNRKGPHSDDALRRTISPDRPSFLLTAGAGATAIATCVDSARKRVLRCKRQEAGMVPLQSPFPRSARNQVQVGPDVKREQLRRCRRREPACGS